MSSRVKLRRQCRTARKVTDGAAPQHAGSFWCQCLHFWHLRNKSGPRIAKKPGDRELSYPLLERKKEQEIIPTFVYCEKFLL